MWKLSGLYLLIGLVVDVPASGARAASELEAMDKDRVEGVGHQVKGSIKEAIGKVTGNTKTEIEGAAEKTAGKAQNAVGGAKDTVRDAAK